MLLLVFNTRRMQNVMRDKTSETNWSLAVSIYPTLGLCRMVRSLCLILRHVPSLSFLLAAGWMNQRKRVCRGLSWASFFFTLSHRTHLGMPVGSWSMGCSSGQCEHLLGKVVELQVAQYTLHSIDQYMFWRCHLLSRDSSLSFFLRHLHLTSRRFIPLESSGTFEDPRGIVGVCLCLRRCTCEARLHANARHERSHLHSTQGGTTARFA